MSKESEINTCLSKKLYKKRSLAEHAIQSMGLVKKLQPYRCPICGGWHIGHIVARAKRLAP